MKLCWLIPSDRGGGVTSVALSCCRQARAAGHEVTLLILRPTSGLIDEFLTFSYDVLNREAPDHRAPCNLVEWLKSHPQDVLLFNDCSPAHPALPFIPDGVRTVFVVHDTAKNYWLPALRYEDSVDAVVAVSHIVADQFRDRLEDPSRLHVVHNGTLFPRDEIVQPTRKRPNDVLFLGGDQPFKGAYDVLKVWSSLIERGFEGNLHWFGRIQPPFLQRIKELPGSDRIILHGHQPRSAVFEQAASARVLLVPSRVEPFGMVTIEGMGLGCVPVAWNIQTGTREIVDHGRSGILVPLGDAVAMARQVMNAIQRHDELAPAAVEIARRKFSEEAMWERYETLFRALLTHPRKVRSQAGLVPPPYARPTRYFQLLPVAVRHTARAWMRESPRLSYWLSNLRGT